MSTIFMKEYVRNSIKILLKYIVNGIIAHNQALGRITNMR